MPFRGKLRLLLVRLNLALQNYKIILECQTIKTCFTTYFSIVSLLEQLNELIFIDDLDVATLCFVVSGFLHLTAQPLLPTTRRS